LLGATRQLLAFRTGRRRDGEADEPHVRALHGALAGGESIVTTGLILQELLQGFAGPRARKDIIERFSALPLLTPDRPDYINAADLRNLCSRSGVQLERLTRCWPSCAFDTSSHCLRPTTILCSRQDIAISSCGALTA